MDFAQRIWPRRTSSSDLNLSLAERLKELCEETQQVSPPTDEDKPGNQNQNARFLNDRKRAQTTVVAAVDSPETTPPVEEAAPLARKEKSEREEAMVSAPMSADHGEPHSPESRLEIPRAEEAQISSAGKHSAIGVAVEPDGQEQEISVGVVATAPDTPDATGDVEMAPFLGRQQQDEPQARMTNSATGEIQENSSGAEPVRQEDSSSSLAPKGPGQQFLDRIQVAVGTKVAGKEPAAQGGQVAPEFQAVQRQFEADLQVRIDGALAEFERRMASQALVDDIAEPFEKKIRQAADSIFREVQGQAWMMHSAVAGELRAFRDQFAKEIQDRVAMLDRSAQQALQLKEKLEEALPRAEEALRSILASGQEATSKFQAASNVFDDHLRGSRESLSREIRSHRETLEALARDYRQEGQQLRQELEKFRGEAGAACDLLTHTTDESIERLNAGANEVHSRTRNELEKFRGEAGAACDLLTHTTNESIERLNAGADEVHSRTRNELEKFRGEAGAACDLLAHTTDQSLERLNAGADEVHSRTRNDLEKLATEAERRILSGGVIEKANQQLTRATEQVIEPAIARVHNAARDADSAAESLARTGQRISGQLDAARQEIDARLESLLGEQLSLLDNTMSGFQEKATAELGNLVERVVAQSTEQLDERLHGLLQDLFSTTSKQVNNAARTTLSTLHHGLKEVFEQAATPSEADSGEPPAEQ